MKSRMQLKEYKLIDDGAKYYVGDLVMMRVNGKVSHIPTDGKKFEDIYLSHNCGEIISLLSDNKAQVAFCNICPFKRLLELEKKKENETKRVTLKMTRHIYESEIKKPEK